MLFIYGRVEKFKSIKNIGTLRQKIINNALLKYLLMFRYNLEEVIFEFNLRGKPSLKNYPNLQFNCSHSRDVIVIGISESRALGVDVEFIDTLEEEDAIAKNFFSAAEYISYTTYRGESSDAFYKFWTAKETLVKLLGKGLWEANQVPEIYFQGGSFYLKSEKQSIKERPLLFPAIQKGYCACLATNQANFELNIQYIKPNAFTTIS